MKNDFIQRNAFLIILCVIGISIVVNIITLNNSRGLTKELKEENRKLELADKQKGELIERQMQIINIQADSLRIAKNTIIVKHNEWVALHEVTQRKIKDHGKITFVGFTYDSLRWGALSELYPTLNH